ncbi:MAG: glycerate kinase, partial [Verrucomicrobia bacterium]|nr:glycerate kinase [Verrucomicrobiota bacterium]
MRALLAFDKFKDSLTAPAACRTAAEALRSAHPDWAVDECPLADGGEGFCAILTQAVGGEFVPAKVCGPRQASTPAGFGLAPLGRVPPGVRPMLQLESESPRPEDAAVAVIEMASASGLALLPLEARDPWQTTTFGTGELIRLAASRGVGAIVLGVGGSATNDLGLGALAALGFAFHPAGGPPVVPPIPARWPEIKRIAGRLAPTLPPIRIACDVTNPLLGPNGAAAIYGPQKGLRPADLARLDHECARLALMLCAHCRQSDALMDVPGTGAA